MGLPDRFVRQGHVDELLGEVGLLAPQIAQRIRLDLQKHQVATYHAL